MAAVVLVIGLLGGCTSSGGSESDPTSATVDTDVAADEEEAVVPASTSPETTAAPTTTVPPQLAASIVPLGELASMREQGDQAFVRGAVAAGDLGLIVGAYRPGPGVGEQAAVWWIASGDPERVVLDEQSPRSQAVDAVDLGDGRALVVGDSWEESGTSRPAAWIVSDDRSVETVELSGPDIGSIQDVAVSDAGVLIAGSRVDGEAPTDWVGTLSLDGTIEVTDLEPFADGTTGLLHLAAAGSAVMVVATTSARESPLVTWLSVDGGVTFTPPSVADEGPFFTQLGGIVSDGSTWWVTACTSAQFGPALLWSDDGGATFGRVDLMTEGLYGPYGGWGCPSAPVVEDGRLFTGVVVWGVPSVAEVDRGGIVSVEQMLQRRTTSIDFSPTVVSARDRVFVASLFTGFDVQVGDLGPLGPLPDRIVTQIYAESGGGGGVVRVSEYPVFEGFNDIDSQVSIRSRSTFFQRDDRGVLSEVDVDGLESVTVRSDGAAIAWLEPAVDEPTGVRLAIRPSASEPFGAPFEVPFDEVPDWVTVAPLPDGWLMLGTAVEWYDESGQVLSDPIRSKSAYVSSDGVTWLPASPDPSPGEAADVCPLPSGDPVVMAFSGEFDSVPGGSGAPVVFRDGRFVVLDIDEGLNGAGCSSTERGVIVHGMVADEARAWSVDDASLEARELVLPIESDGSLSAIGLLERRTTVVTRASGGPLRVLSEIDGTWQSVDLDPTVLSPRAQARSVVFDGGSLVITQALDGVVESFRVELEVR